MRTKTVIGILLLAGLAWAVALAEEVPAMPAAPLPNGRYLLSAATVARALEGAGVVVEASQVSLPGVLTAAVAAPTLRVGSAQARADGELTVRLQCGLAAECLPFFARVKLAGRAEATAAAERLRGDREATPGEAAETGQRGAAVARGERTAGVAAGARVRLELADRQMRLVLQGIAVDGGAPGAEVRVASLDRRQTYRGVVVDATTVKGGVE